jgi:hypothetical protein
VQTIMTAANPSAPATPLQQAGYAAPTRECDIVMKGGITSGVVYPLAVCELAKDYRFRCIGGTSAGAIAAAATAAAEYGRSRDGTSFGELARLPAWLGGTAPAGDRSNLFALFQPQTGTDAVFDVATSALGDSRGRLTRVVGRLLARFTVPALLGTLPGVLLIVLGTQARPAAAAAALVVVGGLIAGVGALAGAAAALAGRFRRGLPANGFGLSTGGAVPGAAAPALTPWLAELINRLAGRTPGEPPLTFGDLWGERVDGEPEIDLRFITTSLSHGRPYQLPLEGEQFFYDPEELRKWFPEWVVAWMEDRSRALQAVKQAEKQAEARAKDERAKRSAARAAGGEPAAVTDAAEPEAAHPERDPDPELVKAAQAQWKKLLPLPAAADLPVIVGARMSLSFPVLISAVPLYMVDYTRDVHDQERAPERCWFSDGGICSNFPVHFFDAPLPARPTFAINLRPFHPDFPPQADEERNSWWPTHNRHGITEWWTRFEGGGGWAPLAGFAGAIVNAMQNWVDNTQLRVPGYRDRVVHVSLDESREGGMNLDMPPDVIQRLGTRGQLAGRKLARRFSPEGDGTPLTWDNHRWVRFRSSMSLLEALLREMREMVDDTSPDGYPALIERAKTDPPSYPWKPKAAADQTDAALADLMALDFLQKPAVFESGAPKPTPELRIMPRL